MFMHICKRCKTKFPGRRRKASFCGKSCAGKYHAKLTGFPERTFTPERMLALSEQGKQRMKENREKPLFQENLKKYLYSERNPFRDPKTQEKAQLVLREKNYPTLNGGNGKGPTLPQKILASRLGWSMEVIVPMGRRIQGYPTHYKIDIGNAILRVAIEIDGYSHSTKKVQERDEKKTAFLQSMGWRVMRFTNEDVLMETDRIMTEIKELVSSIT